MATCLIALGSNLGDRQATLEAAVHELSAIPKTRIIHVSRFHHYAPIGGPADQAEFLNAAALIKTFLEPSELFDRLLEIEIRLGRERLQRWAPRTLDLDLLLYDDRIDDSRELVLPHPRMSFRRFVLEPAAEVAPKMIVPTIGWSIQQLLDRLDSSNARLAVLSASRVVRSDACQRIMARFGGQIVESPVDSELWPIKYASWISFASDSHSEGDSPKLTVILETAASDAPCEWRPFGRGPTLHLRSMSTAAIDQEVSAAIESVWPDLGPQRLSRIQ
jgi:2-amino-4-hydroxy-6-hydroxymethyldihydropteridine diphosphokinase